MEQSVTFDQQQAALFQRILCTAEILRCTLKKKMQKTQTWRTANLFN